MNHLKVRSFRIGRQADYWGSTNVLDENLSLVDNRTDSDVMDGRSVILSCDVYNPFYHCIEEESFEHSKACLTSCAKIPPLRTPLVHHQVGTSLVGSINEDPRASCILKFSCE